MVGGGGGDWPRHERPELPPDHEIERRLQLISAVMIIIGIAIHHHPHCESVEEKGRKCINILQE